MSSFLHRLIYRVWREIDYHFLCLHHADVFLRKRGAWIGQNCDIASKPDNFGSEPYLIRIGNDVTVTMGVRFITHDGSTRLFRRQFSEMNRYGNVFGPIVIGDNCFIGNNTILLPGTQIGSNSIVGAGAVVKGVFPEGSVIVGVPARRVGSLTDYIERVRKKMVPLKARTRRELRAELTAHFFGQSDQSEIK